MTTFSIRVPDRKLEIELQIGTRTVDLLTAQLERLQDQPMLDEFKKRLVFQLDEAIANSVESGLRCPTKTQINLATRISTELGIPLTPEVLRYQECMSTFLSEHSATMGW